MPMILSFYQLLSVDCKICFEVSRDLHVTFNCAKSSCFAIGKGSRLRISDMNLGPNSIEWHDSFKYLGVTFQAGPKLKVNTDVIKRKIYMASNSVLRYSNSLDELIKLQLLASFCLPVLQYATCALELSTTKSTELNPCWNNVYRRVFNFRKYDSVRACIQGLGRSDFHHIRISLTMVVLLKSFLFKQ